MMCEDEIFLHSLHLLLVNNFMTLLVPIHTAPPELAVFRLHLCHNNLVSLAGGHRRREEVVHLLQRNTLRLGDQEEDEDRGTKHERGEKEVDAIVHVVKHLRSESSDDLLLLAEVNLEK